MIDDEFGEWFSSATVEPLTGTGAWGETFGDPVTVPAFWQFTNRVVVTAEGKSVVSDTQLFCGVQYREALKEGSRVSLDADPRKYRVASVKTWPADDAHLEVALA